MAMLMDWVMVATGYLAAETPWYLEGERLACSWAQHEDRMVLKHQKLFVAQ